MANAGIGVKGWRNYSTFSLFGAGSQRADRNTSILVDTYSGNLGVLAVDWNLAARIPCSLARAYNHADSTSGVDRPFGPGWYWQFDMNLTGSMDGTGNVTWKAADGSEYDFTYSAGPVWASPAGMSKYKLTFSSSPSPDEYYITFGRMKYTFVVNTTDSVARLTKIEDAFGNALKIERTYSGGKPTATIEYLTIVYDNSGPTDHRIVQPTYTGSLITKLRLLDSLSGGDYIDLHYTYSTIDSADRLVQVTPKRGTTALNLETKYDYDSTAGKGLQMTKLYDSLGAQAGSPYYWQVTYSGSPAKVATVVFPIDGTPTTGTVTYTYASSEPSSWSHADPDAWNKVTDAESHDWYYGQDSSGRVLFAVDPLWVNSTHESYTEYAYNSDNQVTSVKSPKPNAESGQLTTSYYYNSDKNLAAVVDHYGFVSWYKYGSRASYSTSGTDATVDDIIGVFTPMPNQKAYSDSDHTSSETTPPSLSSPLSVDSFVSWDSGSGYWKYTDGSGSPKTIKLVRSVMDYSFTTGTGKLTELLSCSPENFAEASATSYTLTSASACSKQEFDSTTGDLSKTYTPRQFKDSSLKWTAYTYDQTYGVVTAVEAADSLSASADKKTLYTYNALKTRVTKVQLPQDNTNQWTETGYNDAQFALSVKRKDIQSWGIDPIVAVSVFDNNGNLTQSWQAKPAGTPADWDGDTGGGGYDQVAALTYDRLNRLLQSDQKVDIDQDGTVETLSTYFTYDKNGRQTRVKGPGYDVSGTTYYSYSFTEYDADGRTAKSYNMVASTNSNLTSVPGGTKYVSYDYDLAGNVKALYNQLWTSGDYYKTAYTYDWQSRQIKVSQAFTTTGASSPRVTETHFSASGGVYWSADGAGYKMYPIQDNNGRLVSTHRGSSGGDGDLREYDYNGNLAYYYTYKDVNTDSSNYRTRSEYDLMDRLVNGGREQYTGGSWQNWNENVAGTTFNYNGAVLKTYDKVNSAGTYFTERVYDNWGQLTSTKLPQVPNADGSGTVVYAPASTYDVLGRRSVASDAEGNDTTYTYDLLGRVIKVTDALNYETKTYFDERSNVKEVQSPNGSSQKYTYNARNLLSQTRVSHDATNDDTAYTYDEIGQLTQTDFPDGGISAIEYDQIGRRKKTRSLLSGSDYLDTTYTYDNNNRGLVTTLPGSYTLEYAYDDLGNLLTSTDTNGDDTVYTYDDDNRRATETQPNGLVSTWTYGWKLQNVSSVLYERNTTSGDDITVSYAYDDNGSLLTLTDGRGYDWTKTYDAMGRMSTLVTPNPGGGAYTHSLWYDGNSRMTKTTDFKSVSHYYQYDDLSRMTGHGADSGADDETYTWGCCSEMSAYSDSLGSASLSYDDLSRLTSQTDSNGNNVAYEYDALGRVSKLTPAQGTNYRIEYQYKKNGALSKAKVYDAGASADTDYTYDTTSGLLTQRNFPAALGNNIRTTYAYDSAGRLEYETQTRQAAGTTNLYKTQYAYSYIAAASGGGRQLLRTEQAYSGGAWVNDNKLTYQHDSLGRQNYEERHDWAAGAWSNRYDTTQAYDKNGNRTGYDHNVAGGYTTSYGRAANLSYTFNAVNQLTALTDADDAHYNATVSCDANNNITSVVETYSTTAIPPVVQSTLTTDFTYDALNRLTEHKTTRYDLGAGKTHYTLRDHTIDALGRVAKSSYSAYYQGDMPSVSLLEHVYDGARHIQNYDGTSAYGEVWHWPGAVNGHSAPLRSPNPDTASQKGYNISTLGGKSITQRRTWLNPTTEGNKRELFGQGRPMAKDSSGNGANWYQGTVSNPSGAGSSVESRFFFEGTVAPTDMSRATDSREGGLVGIFGTSNSYGGAYGRVTNEALGRDLNPMGTGNGAYAYGGGVMFSALQPRLLGVGGILGISGNSANGTLCPSMDSWRTQGLLLGVGGNGAGGGGGSCGSCAAKAASSTTKACAGVTPGHPCGIRSDGISSQDFCSVCMGHKDTYMPCPSWMAENPYWGKCVRCCCAPPCGQSPNCYMPSAHPYAFCQWMEATFAREQALLRQGYTEDEMLIRLCNPGSKHECGENSELCPPGYEGGGGDILSANMNCKCMCQSFVNNQVYGLQRSYGWHGQGDRAIDECLPILTLGDPWWATHTTSKCLMDGLRKLGKGKIMVTACGAPRAFTRCWGCGNSDMFGYTIVNDIMVCCLNHYDQSGPRVVDKPYDQSCKTCECALLDTLLHELVHAGGCVLHNNSYGNSWQMWGYFMSCVCKKRGFCGSPLPPVNSGGVAGR